MTSPKASQEARDFATKLYPKNSSFAKVIKSGEGDHFNSIQSFAQFESLIRSMVIDEAAGGQVDTFTVPWTPTEAMWGGLARQIMMWLDFGGRHTPRSLFKHLEMSGHDIPQWLRDEPEMKALDHVPSKGTRCVLIYRAMLSASIRQLGESGR